MRLRNLLAKRGLKNIISIETGFRNIDKENVQELDLTKFKEACEQFNFELNEEEIKELFLAFTKEETTKVNYDEFIRILRGELPKNRKDLVEKVYKEINKENKEGLSLEEVFNLYNPKGSYELLYGQENEENAKKIFENTFEENHIYLNGEEGKNKLIDLDEFIDYYESVSLMIQEDENIKKELEKDLDNYLPNYKRTKKEEKKKKKDNKAKIFSIPFIHITPNSFDCFLFCFLIFFTKSCKL